MSFRPYLDVDGGAKDLVRLRQYQVFREALQRTGKPGGFAVLLPGPKARELPLLRDYLGWAPSKTLFVDRDPTGLKLVRSLCPDATIFHGELRTALRTLKALPVGLVNLDLMGPHCPAYEELLQLVAPHLLRGAILSYTVMLARQLKSVTRDLHRRAAKVLLAEELADRQRVHEVGITQILKESLGFKNQAVIFSERYVSERGTALRTIAVQRGG